MFSVLIHASTCRKFNMDKQIVPVSGKRYREGKLVKRCGLWRFLICHKPKGKLWNLTPSGRNVLAIRDTKKNLVKTKWADIFNSMYADHTPGRRVDFRQEHEVLPFFISSTTNPWTPSPTIQHVSRAISPG